MIYVSELNKNLDGKVILKRLSLEIRRGETMVIIGPSGCGKSVLLQHLIGLMKPDDGRIVIDGVDVTGFTESQWHGMRRRFGMVFQKYALFDSMTVGENIGFALREHTGISDRVTRKIVQEKLELVGLPGIEDKKPSEISGGMAKRVAFARAIAMDPEIILYDEPTTGLDPVMVTVIDKLTKSLQENLEVTSIVVTHDMNSAWRIADRMAVHYGGHIIEVGTPKEIRESTNPVVRQFINGWDQGPMEV
ncbi:MAG: ABC transporter ATP-binding protein [Candidatus Wallbacteria bacterium HGW-Wallbacteria-1]|jgi:phospholipid/cholesterol/gamma-HCH transport system ATP-binding protein|uniref:ABC transporter ATP-binding protein n=1 Tax=Candidatus Wallbacteria bacterium HGW-Wallbacteria-1 TaxID=2013854 RepID=A0A2N1PUK3_9BACT|nr:MAG: ABC transporter ATP-binding protein [Candidatus Wallbacteria bacterium HGW-Wallbacteria-1]